MKSTYVKIAVFVPEANADDVRQALGDAGAGKLENGLYSHCTFSTKGMGRFLPLADANPYIGGVGRLEAVPEERIETICLRSVLPKAIQAMKAAHPYEEVAYDVWSVEDPL